eukprot:574190-Amphidinium_carterae.1
MSCMRDESPVPRHAQQQMSARMGSSQHSYGPAVEHKFEHLRITETRRRQQRPTRSNWLTLRSR